MYGADSVLRRDGACIFRRCIHLCAESVQRHFVILISVDAMTDLRAADLHLRHAGDVQCALVSLDAVCFFQGSRRVFIVHKQAERTGFDIDSLFRRKAMIPNITADRAVLLIVKD